MECVLCETSSFGKKLGKMLQITEEICSLPRRSFHTHCLLYTNDIRQNTDHTKGYHGYEEENITFALQRAENQTCMFCKKKKATIKCKGRFCRKRFHLPCALKSNRTLHLHFDPFVSYCFKHIPVKCIFDYKPLTGIFSPFPCCNQVYSHDKCIKKYAVEAKGEFKCPCCLNLDEFRTFVQTYLKCDILNDTPEFALPVDFGLHAQCEADICLLEREVEDGRFGHDEGGGDFELIECQYCGSNSIHRICGRIRKKQKKKWTCKLCAVIEVVEPNNSVERMQTSIADSKRKQSEPKMQLRSGLLTRKRIEATCHKA